jgi:glycosyltransferase involved in cell wall biosynthesis
MLAGLPVVATNVSSLPELVADGETGLLVAPDDPSALGLALAGALERPELGDAGRARALREFSVARMADRTASLYEAIVRSSAPS